MKKYPIFFFTALIILVICVYTPEAMYASLPKVEYIKVEVKDTQKTVTVSGKIQSKEETVQTADCVYVISDVLVSAGDRIKKGDRILKIDTEQTSLIYSENGETYNGSYYITSEFEGTVNNVFVTEDCVTTENAQLISIIDTDNLFVSLLVGEDVFSKVEIGQTLSITGSAFEKRYKGKITGIGAVATQNTSSAAYISATADITNPDSDLKPGFNVKAKIITETNKNALIVPSNCISQDDNGEFVYRLIGNKAEKAYIKTDDITKDGTIVLSGINEGEYIASNPESIEKDDSYVRKKEDKNG